MCFCWGLVGPRSGQYFRTIFLLKCRNFLVLVVVTIVMVWLGYSRKKRQEMLTRAVVLPVHRPFPSHALPCRAAICRKNVDNQVVSCLRRLELLALEEKESKKQKKRPQQQQQQEGREKDGEGTGLYGASSFTSTIRAQRQLALVEMKLQVNFHEIVSFLFWCFLSSFFFFFSGVTGKDN